MPLRNIYQLLSPTIMGGVQVYLNAPFASSGFGAHIPYVGIASIALALLASVRSRQQRTLLVASLIAAGLIGLKIFGVPPVQWIGYLPFFNHVHFSHYLGAPLGFPLIFIAALGVDALVSSGLAARRVVVATVVSLAAVGCVWWIAIRSDLLTTAGAADWLRDWKVLAAFAASMSLVVVTAALARGSHRVRIGMVVVSLVLIAAEGAYNQRFPRPAAWDVFEHPIPYMRVLRKEAAMGRVFTFGMPAANLNEAFRVFGVDSLMALNPPRMFELYHRYSGAAREAFMRQAGQIPPEPVLDRANVSFIGTYNAQLHIVSDAGARGYEKRFDNGFTTLFSRPSLPRFFFSSEYRIMPAAAALEAVAAAPAREILLEEDPGVRPSPNEPGDAPVEVLDYNFNSQILAVNAARPGLVYASENYFDGWSVTVNGAGAKLLPANYAFRAVAVPAGRSQIEFKYRPPGLIAGLAISTVSAALLAVLAARGRDGA
jgi:hypothetical protein